MTKQDGPSRLAAVCFADVAGFGKVSAADEDARVRVRRELRRLARGQCQVQGGRLANATGEAVLAVFESADGAVRAALSLRDAFLATSEARASGASIRFAVHVGEVTEGADGGVYGDAVNTASRIQPLAAPGQVILTDIAYRLLRQRSTIEIEDLGTHEVKGVPEPVRLYAAALVEGAPQVDLRELLQRALTPLQLLDVQGVGGMGEIYLARDASLRRTLAVKVLRSELVSDAQARARFFREAQIIAGLSHPNVVGIHSVGELPDGTPYFVMDYVEGGSMEDRLTREGPLSVAEARRIVGEVASALQAAHARGVVHRDIKTSNILFDPSAGRAMVTDWGIAALDPTVELSPETRLTRTGMVIGSPRYMSPEQLAGDEVGPESDIYSLGLLAFELLTGEGPFRGNTPRALMVAHLREEPPLLSTVRPEVDPEFESVVARCLAKDPPARPTAEDVARRFAPGAEAILEWPPPGLEAIKGQGSIQFTQGALIVTLLAMPVLLAYSARVEWVGRVVMRDLTSGPTGVGVMVFLIGLFTTFGLLHLGTTNQGAGLLVTGVRKGRSLNQADAFKAALQLGYGWRTVFEVLDDRWGDYQHLIAGRREYAVLDPPARGRIRRRRIRRAALRWASALSLPFTLIAGVHLVATGRLEPLTGLGVGLGPPVLLWLLSMWPTDPHAVRLARAVMERKFQAPETLRPQVTAWGTSLEKVAGPAGPHPGRPTSRRTWTGYMVAYGLFGTGLYVYFITALISMAVGSIGTFTLGFDDTAARFSGVVAAAVLRLPPDSSTTAQGAAELVSAIVTWDPRQLPWEGSRPGEETIPGSPLLGSSLSPPHTLAPGSVIQAALGGLSPQELAYLRGFGGDPRFPSFERLARAERYDPGLPDGYHSDMLFSERSEARPLVPMQDVALHKLAFAGYLVASGDPTRGETTLREIFSVGALLATESNDLNAALLGRNVATMALGALGALDQASGRASEAALASQAVSPRLGTPGAQPGAPRRERLQEWLDRSTALASDPSVPRAVRLETLGRIVPASVCTGLDGILFGPTDELRELEERIRGELVRYPGDEAYLDMAVHSAERLDRRIAQGASDELRRLFGQENRVIYWTLLTAARIYRNPRFITCPAMMGMP